MVHQRTIFGYVFLMKEQIFVPKTPKILAIITDPPSTIVQYLESGIQIPFCLAFKTYPKQIFQTLKKSISNLKKTIFWISFWTEVQILKGIGVKIATACKVNFLWFSNIPAFLIGSQTFSKQNV